MSNIFFFIAISILCVMIFAIQIIQYLTIQYLKSKNNELTEQHEILLTMYSALKVKIRRKKELLEIQDRLIEDLQNKNKT